MFTRQILAIVSLTAARSLRRWIFHLGGLGFIPLGIVDSSVIPLPGSMDVLTILLSAPHSLGLCAIYASPGPVCFLRGLLLLVFGAGIGLKFLRVRRRNVENLVRVQRRGLRGFHLSNVVLHQPEMIPSSRTGSVRHK